MSFMAGVLTGVLLFSGAKACAAGVIAERSTNRVFVNGCEVQIESWDFYHNDAFLQTQYYIFIG